MNSSTSLSLYRSDPITYFFRSFLRLPAWASTVIFLLLVNIPLLIASLNKGVLFSRGNTVGFFEDYGWWIYQLGTFPATLYALLWLPEGIQHVLDGLRRNRVIIILEEDGGVTAWDQYLVRFQKSYSHWIWSAIAVGLTGIFMVIFWIPDQYTFNSWQNTSDFAFWFTIFAWIVMFIAGILLVIKGVLTIIWLNRLFKEFEVGIRILHPDGAGGLSPLGKFSANIGYVLGIYGIGLVVGNLSEARISGQDYLSVVTQPYVLILWGLYLLLAPVIFFLPLGVAHSTMKKAKDEYVSRISDQFDLEIEKIYPQLSSDTQQFKLGIEKIEQLQRLYNITSRFPVWPFNHTNLVRFSSSVLTPLALSLLTILLESMIR